MADDLDDVAIPDDLDDLDDNDDEALDEAEPDDLDDEDDLGGDDLADGDDYDVVDVAVDEAEPHAAGTGACAAAEDDEGDDEEEPDDEDVEASLDVILKERLVVVEEEPDDEELADVDDRSETTERVLPKQPDEFVCRSCFLVKHPSQLADKCSAETVSEPINPSRAGRRRAGRAGRAQPSRVRL